MQKIYDGLLAVLQVFAGVLCLVMLGVVLLGIFYRYIVDASLSWYDEFAGFTLVWLTMYGSVVALAKGKHISFETLVEKLPKRGQYLADVVVDLFVLSFSIVLLVYGWQLVREMGDETAVSVTAVKMSWIYGVMPITGGLMVLIGVVQLVKHLHLLVTPDAAPQGPRAQSMQEAQ